MHNSKYYANHNNHDIIISLVIHIFSLTSFSHFLTHLISSFSQSGMNTGLAVGGGLLGGLFLGGKDRFIYCVYNLHNLHIKFTFTAIKYLKIREIKVTLTLAN